MSTSGGLGFTSGFDEVMAHSGPPALFTINQHGELRLNEMRTREAWERAPAPTRAVCHCLFRDRSTGWVQYVLATSADFLPGHPRAEVVRYPDQAAALRVIRDLGALPVSAGPLPDPG